jgi:tetratricopeptide (TPR) repeat protein
VRIERLRERLHSYVQAGAWDAAELTLTRWAELQPSAIEPTLHRSRVHTLQGRNRAAYDCMAHATVACVCPAELLLDTVLCLQELAAGPLMSEVVCRCEDVEKASADDLTRCASVLLRFGLANTAAELLRLAEHKSPQAAAVLLNQAFLHFYLGDVEQAEQRLERLIGGSQDVAMAHWLLSRQRRQTRTSNHVARLRQRLSLDGLHEDDRAYLGFALFKELDDLGEHKAAWQSLQTANAVLARLRPYDPALIEQRFAAIQQQCAEHPWPPAPLPFTSGRPTPIFIIGMHRSGTSLLEQLLSGCPGVLACGETQRLRAAVSYATNAMLETAADGYFTDRTSGLDSALAAEHFFKLSVGVTPQTRFMTEKWPMNFQKISLIKHLFPNARVIHMRRDPMDLCFANYRERLADGSAQLNSLAGLAHFHQAYSSLMNYWHAQYPGFILDVHYEALVNSPSVQLQRVIHFCGMQPMGGDALPHASQQLVATPSAAQVREPVHTGSVGRWRVYQQQLAPLQHLLENQP